MPWKDRKVTELKAGDIITVRRNNARDKVRSSKIIGTYLHDGKSQLFLNCPKEGENFGKHITHQIEHNEKYIYFRWEEETNEC